MSEQEETLDESMEETLNQIRDKEFEELEDEPEQETKAEVENESETPVETTETAETENAEPEVQEDRSHVNPPSTWRAEAKSKWATIDPAIKAEIHKREGDAMRGAEMLKEDAQYGKQITSVVAPYMPTIRSKGATAEEAIGTMLNAYHVLETASPNDKAQQILATAQQYGVLNEIGALLNNRQPVQPQGITQEQFSQRLAEERQSWEQQQTTQTIQSEVEQFASAANEDGSLKHPYFDNVRGTMGALVQSDPNMTIDQAYESAIWAHPDIRNLLPGQQASSEGKNLDAARTHAEKAKRARQNNLRTKPSHGVRQPNPTGSVDDTMQEALDNLKARA
jgi:hypothetical protein